MKRYPIRPGVDDVKYGETPKGPAQVYSPALLAEQPKWSRGAHITRRRLLGTLGAGAALLAPFVRNRTVMAQAAPQGNLIIFFSPNGHKRKYMDTTGSGASMVLGSSLAPLEPVKGDIAVVRGICQRSPTSIKSHEDISRVITCVSGPDRFTGYGPSIDHAVGKVIGQRPLVVAIDPYRDAPHWRTALSWRDSTVNEPFLKDPKAIFMDIFGGAMSVPQGDPAAAAAALARNQARGKSILDYARKDIATFRAKVNSADRVHLDTYLDSLKGVEDKLMKAPAPMSCSPSSLMTAVNGIGVAPKQNDDKSPNGVAMQLQQRGELMMDLITTAFACGTRRIATIQWQGASEGYDPVGNTGSPYHHSISHGAGGNPEMAWAAVDTWYASRFAYLVQGLKAQGVLDRTIIAWVTEISEEHNQNDHLVVLAGGQALGMKMGQGIRYPFTGSEGGGEAVARDTKNKGFSDLWVTVQQALGVKSDKFGDPQWNSGPYAELRSV
jgi:hypothetical protein